MAKITFRKLYQIQNMKKLIIYLKLYFKLLMKLSHLNQQSLKSNRISKWNTPSLAIGDSTLLHWSHWFGKPWFMTELLLSSHSITVKAIQSKKMTDVQALRCNKIHLSKSLAYQILNEQNKCSSVHLNIP